jgi:hypothetical protein
LDLRFFGIETLNNFSIIASKINQRISIARVNAFDFADENRVIAGDEILNESAFEIDERVF